MKGRSKKHGFSLAEILVSIAILAVIAAVVVPSIGSQLRSGDEGRIQQDLTNIRAGIEQYLADVRRYPVTVGQLVRQPTTGAADTALVGGVHTTSQVNRWRGPYLTKDSVTAVATGFDATITNRFTREVNAGQNYLVISLANFDSVSARNIDLRIDDGVKTTGSIQWAATALTTLKYFAIPVQ